MGCCLSSSSRGESDESPTPTSPTHPILNRTTTDEAAQSHHNRSTTSRSGRHRRALAGVPLDVHYNQAVQPHIWRSTRREWTREQLARERELFFETRVTGRPEVWAALKTATSLVRAGDMPTAQGILDAAGITVPTGDLCDGCYDESGVLYRIPEPIAMDPVNVIEEVAEANDVNTICATTAELGAEGVEHNKLAVDVDSDDDTVDDIERRREEKGKVSERDLIKISARLSDRGGPDLTVMIGKNQTVGTLARRIQTEAGIAGKHRVRIAYLGKILKEQESLLSQGWREGHVVNALVVISSRS
ncbi:ubiquitin domain-containing protein [Blastomyces gilchristii SLH14081]|uniref:Ubiquitin domain-containing protein n=1 Tax=Blastomyces gilchristii (strain SLH14081) TaxID=559298 RepID=A0A179U8C1_BLAGS|nr:ubiquitin domain-containing protein [Blastomyces gilchristii SLH14081]OAT03558.1 ubiquitin domain-containing protein [Blastomyces gilchristii SLH14081]